MQLVLLFSKPVYIKVMQCFKWYTMEYPTSHLNFLCIHMGQPVNLSIDHFRVTESLSFKARPGAQVHNHSYENEFNLHVNEISFSYESMNTKTRFEKEAKGNSQMAYFTFQKTWTLPYPHPPYRFNTVTDGKHSLSYLGPKLWAKLSKDIRKSETLNKFKSWLRTMNLNELISKNCSNKYCLFCSK